MTGEYVDVALLIPLSGSAGMFGPSCECCAEIAAEGINAARGLLGRQIRLVPVDGSRSPAEIGHEIALMLRNDAIDAVVGWHTSAVRQELVDPRVHARIPYVYTAVYEGGEHSPGVFLTGETPRVAGAAGDAVDGPRARCP